MQALKKLLLGVAILLAVGSATIAVQSVVSRSVAAEEGPKGDHWRNFDGHWSYWHAGDNRWYYTDGLHWYYYGPAGWAVYEFDKIFGRDFHHGDYKAPHDVPVPKHKVFR
jgi:hypothetical protein